MRSDFQSAVFGVLIQEPDFPGEPDYSSYAGKVFISGHGTVDVTLTLIPTDPSSWESFIKVAERSHPLLIQREPAVRAEAAAEILAMHRECYGEEWNGTAEELARSLSLMNLNYFSEGCFELWYSGGEGFHFHDVRIELDPAMDITEVGLEG